MRNPAPVYVGLVVASGIASAIFWRDLHTERLLTNDLRTQLADAKTALAARPPAQCAVVAAPQPSVEAKVACDATASTSNAARDVAATRLLADSGKREKALLADSEYRKARLAQFRVDLKQRYASLPVELGLSEAEADALFDQLAENQMNQAAASADFMAGGNAPDAAGRAAAARVFEELQKKQDDALVAMLGPDRFTQLKEYEQTQPSRTRVTNLTNLLARSNQPLSNAQTRSLTAAIIAEQKRMESEVQALGDAGQTSPQSQADRQAETNRRILESAAKFLSAQQLELVRGRFQQRNTIDRAADRVQQREREVLQEPPR